MTEPKKRRTNAEILAAQKADREAVKNKVRRKRRTKAEMERDRRKEADEKLKKELAAANMCKVVTFYAEVNAFGNMWQSGQEVKLIPGTLKYSLAFDKNNNFILDKSPEEQLQLWQKVKYTVREEPL